MFSTKHDLYKKYKILEENYTSIESEIPAFIKDNVTISRSHGLVHLETWSKSEGGKQLLNELEKKNDWLKVSQVCGNDVHDWYNYTIMINNIPFGNAEFLCPKTTELLKSLGTINLAGFSLMMPNGVIPPHTDCTGPTYKSMACNLHLSGTDSDLFVFNKTLFNMNILKHHHKKGECVFFNSENTHWVKNNANELRVILYLEISLKDDITKAHEMD